MHDSGSFDAWYRETHARLVATMTVAAGDLEVAREVTDEAFARALERWARVQHMKSREGWVYRVALNALRRRARRRILERRLLATMSPTVEIPPVEIHTDLWRALRSLAPRARTAIALRYISDLPEADIAAAMGIAPGTVARTLHDARKRLAVVLGEEEPVPMDMADGHGGNGT